MEICAFGLSPVTNRRGPHIPLSSRAKRSRDICELFSSAVEIILAATSLQTWETFHLTPTSFTV